MSNKRKILLYFLIVIFHFVLLAFCVKTNTFLGIGLDESRYIPAGVWHWRHGDFAPANDSPPLPRMIAALPLLPLGVQLEPYIREGRSGNASARERELRCGGRFASSNLNFHKYRFFCLARMMGFPWWLLGAWVIGRWAGELHGAPAGLLALALWSICPNVLALEQRATPDLPLAVIWAAATYAFRGYLLAPCWSRAAASGLLLGVAQLVDFASLALVITWILLALLHLARVGGVPAGIAPRTRVLQAIVAFGLSVWVINVAYGFGGSGTPLGDFDFASRALQEGTPPLGGRDATGSVGNRFRGTWLGRVACPLPADYLKGLDRRLDERERPPPRPGTKGWPVEVGDDPLATAAERRPIGIWGMMLGGVILMAGRRLGGDPVAGELTPWIPIGAALFMMTSAVDLLSGAAGVLLTTPFAIVIASSLAGPRRSGPRVIGWVAALLAAWAIADGVQAICVHQITPENRARLGLDLDKYRRRLGLPEPGRRAAAGMAGERGLLYRSFVDSRGVAMNYVLSVPRGYRGDRPYPLILFLHGYGDRGTVGRQFAGVGLPFTLRYREVDFLVLCPQGRSGTWEPGGDDARGAMELLAAVEQGWRVDPERISLTGLSSGGTGVWDLAAEYPGRWAAIVPVASGPRSPDRAPLIKHIPCWCFHNYYDGGSPAEDVRVMIEALRAAGGRPKYTEFLDVNHGAWDRAYNLPELFDWLSRHKSQ